MVTTIEYNASQMYSQSREKVLDSIELHVRIRTLSHTTLDVKPWIFFLLRTEQHKK